MRRFVLLLLGLLAAVFALAGPASAHAEFVGSSPGPDARLTSAPSSVTVRFDDGVGLGFVHVTGPSGARVDVGSATHPGGDRTRVAVRLRSGLGDGTYIVRYRVVADDAHPVAGVVRFGVGAAPSLAQGGGDTSDAVVSAALDCARWLSWAGFALLGGSWLLLTVWQSGREERRARRLVQVGWVAAVAGAVLELLLQGAYVAGQGLGSVLHGSLLADTLRADYGELYVARLALLLLMALLPARVFFWPLAAGVAFTFSAIGHPRTTDPVWLSITLDMLHLLAIAAWVGGVAMILGAVLPRAGFEQVRGVLPVFSRVAFVAVTLVAITGTYAAWRGMGSWRALIHTEYGLLVLGKVLGFIGLLAVGNLARTVIQRRVRGAATADATALEQLRRCVLVEAVVASIVLALAAVLVSQPRGAETLALALGGIR